MLKDGISVIICCYNSAWVIERCLEALTMQKFSNPIDWEVIVVDNCCTDNTIQIAESFINMLPLQIVYENEAGLLYARKKGILMANYMYSIFCDDDNILSPGYVFGMYKAMTSNSKLGCIGGQGIEKWQAQPDDVVLQFLNCYAIGSQKDLKFLYGAGICVRTDLVREIYSSEHFYLTGRCGSRLLAGDDTEMVISILARGYKEASDDSLTFNHVLAGKRLTYSYLKGMMEGFGLSAPILRAKGHALQGHPFWFIYLTFIKCCMKVVVYLFLSPFSKRRRLFFTLNYSMIKAFPFWTMATIRDAYESVCASS